MTRYDILKKYLSLHTFVSCSSLIFQVPPGGAAAAPARGVCKLASGLCGERRPLDLEGSELSYKGQLKGMIHNETGLVGTLCINISEAAAQLASP